MLELGSYHAIVSCVTAGAGGAVAPRSVFDLQPQTENVMQHAIAGFGEIDTLLAWRQGYASSGLAALRDALAKAAQAPQPEGVAKPSAAVPV